MRNIFCSAEVVLGAWLLDGSGLQKDQATVKILGFSVPPPYSPEREEGLEMELIMDHAHNIYRSLHKLSIVGGLESFQVDKHTHVRRMTHLSSTGTEAPALGILSDLTPCSSSSGSSVAFIISFDNLVNVFP